MNSWGQPRFLLRWSRRLATAGMALLLSGCFQPYGDIREELKALTRDLRGHVIPLGSAPALPEPAVPLIIERDPFNAAGR